MQPEKLGALKMQGKIFAAALFAMGVALAGCNAEKPKAYAMTPEGNAQYLTDNKAKEGVKTTASGLQYRVITSGSGKSPTGPSDMVTVTYKGSLIDGTVFDETPSGETAHFPAGGLIPGWVEALKMMKEGDEWELTIPSDLAYGPEGAGGGKIPGGATLIFRMKLIKVMTAEDNAKYLADNKAKPDVKTTASGLQYRVIASGNGKSPTSPTDMVTVSYKGTTVDGHVFDQTQPGETREFPAGRLIPGWVEALRMMKEGDEWELTIPAELAYGENSPTPEIPPGATLVFTMKLISVKPG
jgi:peptidylprolyl isomerase